MVYNIGHWTKSTLSTLLFIKERNDSSNNPRLHNFPSGTYRNWVYPLLNAGYIIYDEGYKLTNKGIELLQQLMENPPIDRRGKKILHKKKSIKSETGSNKNVEQVSQSNNAYHIKISGTEMVFEVLISREEANQIIKAITDIVDKKK